MCEIDVEAYFNLDLIMNLKTMRNSGNEIEETETETRVEIHIPEINTENVEVESRSKTKGKEPEDEINESRDEIKSNEEVSMAEIILNPESFDEMVETFDQLIDLLEHDKLIKFNNELSIGINSILLDIPPLWANAFEVARDDLKVIVNRISEDMMKTEKTVFPEKENIFRAFKYCSPEDIKVIILGQDPYHQVGVANGLSFSVPRGLKINRSLQSIYRELERTIDNFRSPDHGDLTAWAEQGILLLNSSLTVYANEPNSHKGYWLPFVKKIFEYINEVNKEAIFVFWGNEAKKLQGYINSKSHVFTHCHPVAYGNKFAGNNHFNKINNKLIELGREPIDWSL